jgi:hypothetical protein
MAENKWYKPWFDQQMAFGFRSRGNRKFDMSDGDGLHPETMLSANSA